MIDTVVLTGSSGFIGKSIALALARRGCRVRMLLRSEGPVPAGADSRVVGDLRRPHGLAEALAGADAVVHAAGLTAAAGKAIGASEADYFAANTEATVSLARACAQAGIRRFVFLSSISAQAGSIPLEVLTEDLPARPVNAYGRSKLAAEQGLSELDLDWVALRPIAVYGQGMTGKMASLVRLARSPFPLPFGCFSARRSLLHLDNLTQAVSTVLTLPALPRGPLIVAEPGPLTIPQIITRVREGSGRPPGLVSVPLALVGAALAAVGQQEAFRRFKEPFVADPGALLRLGWVPAVDTAEWLQAMGRERTGWPQAPVLTSRTSILALAVVSQLS